MAEAQMSAQAAVKPETGGTVGRVLALVDAMLAKKGRPGAGRDQDLREAGLSSLDTMNLMLAVEGEFDLFIPQAEMTPENFRTVEAIADLLDRLL
jgi:acyl carrier protein